MFPSDSLHTFRQIKTQHMVTYYISLLFGNICLDVEIIVFILITFMKRINIANDMFLFDEMTKLKRI